MALAVPVVVCLAADPGAVQLYRDAQRAERTGDNVRAYLLYAQAAAKDPTNLIYWSRAQALRPLSALEQSGKPAETKHLNIDPAVVGSISDLDIQEAKRHPLPPPELQAAPGAKDFDLNGDSKTLFEQVARAFNLLVVFDSGYEPSRPLRFQITGAGYTDALRALEDATNSFIVPVADRLILVANDTPQKRTELDSTASVLVPVPEALSPQEVQELATGVRGTLEIQRLIVDNQRRIVLIRDHIWKVRAAQALFHDLMRPRAQVAIELDIISADQNNSYHYGLQLPTSSNLVAFGGALNRFPKNLLTSVPAGLTRFLALGGGASFLGLGLTDATLFATATKSTTTSLLQSEVVTVDGLPASFHVGDRYPLVTGSYFAGTSGTQGFVPPPQFNFEDLGLLMKITPHVHSTDEMTLEVSAEFKLLGATSLNGIPVISSRKFESKVRLVNGEWAILAGLVNAQDMKTVTGIPGLLSVPLLHEDTRSHDRSEAMIVLKPHLLSLPPAEAATNVHWIGTETKPNTL